MNTDQAKKLLSEVLAAERETVASTLERLTPRDRDEFLRLLDVYVDA